MRITLHHEARRAAVQAPHRCVACGYQGTASGSVSWRLRRAFGLPMRVFQVETELTCPSCGARAVRLGGVRGQPPARDRFGGVVLFGALAMVPIVVWIAAMPPASVDATARQRLADSEAELFRGYAERDRYRVQLAGCEVAWRQRIDAIAGALATGPEIPLAAADEARLLAAPVIAANHQSETLARHYASWDQSTRGPHCASRVELEPHMGPELDPDQTRARVDRWVAGMRDIADSDAIVAADYRCTRGRCTSTLAFLDRDGRVLALARAPARPDKNPANPVGDRLRARRQADEVAPPAPRPDRVAP